MGCEVGKLAQAGWQGVDLNWWHCGLDEHLQARDKGPAKEGRTIVKAGQASKPTEAAAGAQRQARTTITLFFLFVFFV